jgi:tetratricopeptide (TPR) repeat protein
MTEMTALSAHDYCVRIDGLIERRRFAQATALLGEALPAFPDNSDLLHSSARIDYLNDEHEAALQTLRQILATAPKHVEARYLLVGVHEARDELAQAEAALLDMLRDYPEFPELYAKYSMLMYRALQVDKAKSLAQEALRLDPENESALGAILIGNLIDGRKEDQQHSLAELLRKHPEDLVTARLLIIHLINRGNYWAAKRIAIELLKAQPDSREILTLVVELDALAHWSVLPLWPMNRWGIAGAIGFYVLCMVGINILRKTAPGAVGAATVVLLTFVAYSWVYPPLLTRWLKRSAGL